jgi:hypothetical protein
MNLENGKNEMAMQQALIELQKRLSKIALGGGKKAINKQHEKNKLTARAHRLPIDFIPNSSVGAFAVMKCMKKEDVLREELLQALAMAAPPMRAGCK